MKMHSRGSKGFNTEEEEIKMMMVKVDPGKTDV